MDEVAMSETSTDQTAHRKAHQPAATPPVVDRSDFESAVAAQWVLDKEVTRAGDRAAAARRRLPMVEVEDYEFTGEDGPVRLSELFAGRYLLLVQNVMFGADWDAGCPSCSWAVDNLPANMGRLDEEEISFAMISEAPIDRLRAWREMQGWPHTWVSSAGTTYHWDWGWTLREEDGGYSGPVPGYSYYLLREGRVFLTYATWARGTEAILPVAQIMDRTVYGRQQDWEDSPEGWPQYPTYG
ncbi:DUF899 family protein [Brachybacterium sp. FME24]|uniref:DUF899 family protein n=1 Tax=Brachybacterium sp. FME24 TaxID=2742605 RepID=UPI001D035675|nr:DUF899 family protein [Brachybacterium sp. FME24]